MVFPESRRDSRVTTGNSGWTGEEIVKFSAGMWHVITEDRCSLKEILVVYIKKAVHSLELIGIYILIN